MEFSVSIDGQEVDWLKNPPQLPMDVEEVDDSDVKPLRHDSVTMQLKPDSDFAKRLRTFKILSELVAKAGISPNNEIANEFIWKESFRSD